jgi:hypothetical protein
MPKDNVNLREDVCPSCGLTIYIKNLEITETHIYFEIHCCGCDHVVKVIRKRRDRH